MYRIETGDSYSHCDFAIFDGSYPILVSLVDVEIRNRKTFADIVMGKRWVFENLKTGQKDTHYYQEGTRFKFKHSKCVTPNGVKTHSILKTSWMGEVCINWDDKSDCDVLARFIQNNLSVPVTSDLVARVIEHQENRRGLSPCIKKLSIFCNNPNFEHVRGFSVDKYRLLAILSEIETGLPDTEFDWDSIETTEDYLLRFIDPIKDSLNDRISVLYNPDNINQGMFKGIQPLNGQIPLIQSAIEVLKNNEKYVYIGAEMGTGKAQPLDAKLLTPNGWVTMGEAYVGMPIIGSDGKTHKVTGVFPQGIKPAYRVSFQDGSSTECCDEHLWNVKDKQDRHFRTLSLRKILNQGIKNAKGERIFSIPSLNFRDTKFIDSVEYVGDKKQQCISVSAPDRLYVTDDYILTHNTIVGIKTNDCNLEGKNYATLAVVPAITLTQWRDEIRACLGDSVDVHIIRKTTEFISLYNEKKTYDKPTYFLVSKETFKLDSVKVPGIVERTTDVTLENEYGATRVVRTSLACCPDCGVALQNVRAKELTYLTPADFGRKPKLSTYKCFNCDSVLWQASYNKTRKASLMRFIKTKNIQFDSLILDEAHESNNAGSLIGTATRTLLSRSKNVILLSGTTNNGYASSMYNLMMGLNPRKLIEDGCGDAKTFIETYGTMVATETSRDEVFKICGKTNFKDSDFREIEGINPIFFTKYLASNYVFAELADLGESLPNLLETYVPIEHDPMMAASERSLREQFKDANRFGYKMYDNTIVRHYTNNPYNWDAIPVMFGDIVTHVQPRNMSPTLKKDEKLVEIVKTEHAEGRKSWVYVDFSGPSNSGQYQIGENIPDRLKRLFEAEGLRCFILNPNVPPIKRKETIDKNKDKYDVFISNPVLTRVGVNMQFCPTYIFYIPSYMVNTVTQASRRGYRVNSKYENRIYHLYYRNSIESEIMERYQLKMVESKAIEAKFNFQVNIARTASAMSKRIFDSLSKEPQLAQ